MTVVDKLKESLRNRSYDMARVLALYKSYHRRPAYFAGNERFVPEFQRSLLSGYALNKQTGHGRGKNLGTRLIFSLPRVVRSINVQYLPHPHRDTSP